jgi:hypothetical protein
MVGASFCDQGILRQPARIAGTLTDPLWMRLSTGFLNSYQTARRASIKDLKRANSGERFIVKRESEREFGFYKRRFWARA